MDSQEYEWESLSNASYELRVDVIHTYAIQPNGLDEPSIGIDEFGSQSALVGHTGPSRTIPNLDTFMTFTIGSTLHVTRDESFHVNKLEASITLVDLSQSHRLAYSTSKIGNAVFLK